MPHEADALCPLVEAVPEKPAETGSSGATRLKAERGVAELREA